MKKHEELSDDPIERIGQLVENSSPNPDRPRLPEEFERRLAEVERRSAACYAGMEELCSKVARLVKDADREHNGSEAPQNGQK